MAKKDYRYNYIIPSAASVRVMYFVALISYAFAVAGLIQFFNLSIWYWALIAPLFIPSVISKSMMYFVNIFYQGFDLKDHEKLKKKFWSENHPAVDVFLPIAGEDISILQKTWKAVSKLNYDNYKVYVLEDKVDLKARKLAKDLGFNYLSRPNKGEYKKAGNLKYGYENSNGEFVVILDADFVPHPDFIKEAVPYFSNDTIGVVQTPQYFDTDDTVHKRSPIEFGAGNVVEDFYRINQVARDFFGAAICVGTNSIFRRKALYDSHAPKLVERSEDVVSGLTLFKHGYELKYVPLILAKGICPDDIESYFKQHNRWGTGSVELLFSSFFWRIKMGFVQRLIYMSSSMYYLAEASSVILSIQLFALLYFHQDSISLGHSLWFLPHLFMTFIVLPASKISRPRWGTVQAAMTHVYTYFYSIYTLLIGNTMEWVPTNLRTSKVSARFMNIVWLNRLFLTNWILLLAFAIWRTPEMLTNPNAYLVLFWTGYGILFHGLYAISIARFVAKKNAPEPAKVAKKVRIKKPDNKAGWSIQLPSTPLFRLSTNLFIFSVVFASTSAVIYANNTGGLRMPNLTNGQGIETQIQLPEFEFSLDGLAQN